MAKKPPRERSDKGFSTRGLLVLTGALAFLGMIGFGSYYFYYRYLPGQNRAAKTSPVKEEGEEAPKLNRVAEADKLAEGPGLQLVKAHCLACHSEKLITQNRATRDGWESMIRWMRKTQKLGDLGDDEGPILDYLAKNYGPDPGGRRKPLDAVDWYEIENE